MIALSECMFTLTITLHKQLTNLIVMDKFGNSGELLMEGVSCKS